MLFLLLLCWHYPRGSGLCKAAVDQDLGEKHDVWICQENRICKRKERGQEDSAFSGSLVALRA